MEDRNEIKRALNSAREKLRYWKTTTRNLRSGSREQGVRFCESEVVRLKTLFDETKPVVPTLSHRSMHFIGPIRPRGSRGDGPTITCFRCEEAKPRDEFYSKGTTCKCCTKKRADEWHAKNPEKAKKAKDKWASENRASISESQRIARAKNPEKARALDKAKRKRNRLENNRIQREYLRKRKRIDPKWRALMTCKRRMWILFKSVGQKKVLRSKELLGIDRAGLFAHLESLFKPGMAWSNRGKYGWHIDHLRPCALFDMTDPEQAKACWNYKNLQPLWWWENLAKSDNYSEPVVNAVKQ